MALIDDVIGELGAAKKTLEEAKSAGESAGGKTDEAISTAESLGTDDKVEQLQALREQVNSFVDAIDGLASSADDLVAAAQAVSGNT